MFDSWREPQTIYSKFNIFLFEHVAVLPVIGGGSMVFGPKNDGISLDVVTGVFKSPVCASEMDWWCAVLESRSIWFGWCDDGWLLSLSVLLLFVLIQLMLLLLQLMPGDVLVLLLIVKRLLLLLLLLFA